MHNISRKSTKVLLKVYNIFLKFRYQIHEGLPILFGKMLYYFKNILLNIYISFQFSKVFIYLYHEVLLNMCLIMYFKYAFILKNSLSFVKILYIFINICLNFRKIMDLSEVFFTTQIEEHIIYFQEDIFLN